tara:strand:+ start:34 stop:417 length:384 start_codon:yes stop_codon:yes gene_type:complete
MDDIIDKKSNKSFGLVFAVVFLILSYFFKENPLWFYGLLSISLVLVIISFFKSSILYLPNKYWLKFGYLLGSIISPIVMGIIYLGVVYPTNIILRLFKKDILDLKIDKNANSYWKTKNKINSMDNQF